MNSSQGYNLGDCENDDSKFESGDGSSNNCDILNPNMGRSGTIYDASECGEINPVIAMDSDPNVSGNEGKWAELPSLAIENIYSYLSRGDQCRMSLVCSRWANDFNSPSLWKTMTFILPERDYSLDIYPEVRFARKYAAMFRHVEIICKRVKTHLIEVILRQLMLFLQALESSSQLTSIKFIDMESLFNPLSDIQYYDLFQAIVSFFNSQEYLQTVVFQESRFSIEEGMKLLKAVFHSDRDTIKNLKLRGFVNEAPSMAFSQQYVSNLWEVCSKFSRVQSIELDYTQIFEDLMNCLHDKLTSGDFQPVQKKPSISTLLVYCEVKSSSLFNGITPETWKHLASVFPSMKVKMDVTVQEFGMEIQGFGDTIILKEIPLHSLDVHLKM